MKKIKFLSLFILIILGCSKQEIEPDLSFNMKNSVTGFDYNIKVIQKGNNSNSKVYFVLDAIDLMPIVIDEYDKLNISKGATFIGIYFVGKNKRMRDYTPTENGNETGMADKFYNFIKSELNNELVSRNIINSSGEIGLIGHSIGGMAASYAFCTQNDYFSNYIIMSPALFWDDFAFFEIESNLRDSINTNSATIYIGAGKKEDFSINTGYHQWTSILKDNYQNVNLKHSLFKGDHYGSRGNVIYEGLKHTLK